MTTADDMQVGGDHYQKMAVQPWAAMEAWMTREQFAGYLLGSAVAYLARFNAAAPGKGGLEDVKKARHCLDKLISTAEALLPAPEEQRQHEAVRACLSCRHNGSGPSTTGEWCSGCGYHNNLRLWEPLESGIAEIAARTCLTCRHEATSGLEMRTDDWCWGCRLDKWQAKEAAA